MLSYLANEEEVLKDGAVNLHHHEILRGVGVEEIFRLHLFCLYNDDHLLLDFVKSRSLRGERDGLAILDDEDVCLVVVRPELFDSIPI